jgi:F-type H+-transporting ATPase subunit gamma
VQTDRVFVRNERLPENAPQEILATNDRELSISPFTKAPLGNASWRLSPGKKAENFFKRSGLRVDRSYPGKVDKLGREEVRDLSEFLMRHYVLNKTDGVYVIYNEFRSILSPRITAVRLLPVGFEKAAPGAPDIPPDWEPEVRILIDSVLPLYVESQIHHALFESQAAEQAARMMAMDNATKNAEQLISDLVLVLNKIRQASITKELLEIMTAVDALAK